MVCEKLKENGILCVHVIGYGLRVQDHLQDGIWYKLWTRFEYIQGMVQDLQGIIQALVQDLQAVQEVLTSSIRFWIFDWNTKGTSRCFMGWWVDG